jgi:hypothetical protein
MKWGKLIGICCFSILQSAAFPTFAGSPVWTFTPLTQTTFSVTPNSSVTVQYRLTNQSTLTHVLMMQPVAGITQNTSTGYCANPFTLSYHQSCILNLQIQGGSLQGNVNDEPIVCEQGGALQCYQPPVANRLSITLESKINLTIGNTPLTLTVGSGSGGITITNPSTDITIMNLQADLTGTALAGNVTQDASHCVNLLPGQTCTLTFSPHTNAVTLTSFPIVGTNANPAAGQIQIEAAVIATITVSGSPLTLQATNGTPVTGSLTVTNQSNTLTARNISADISGTLANAGVTENSSNCNSVLPQQSCNLVFTPDDQAASSTNVTIQGSNTSVTSANISVNGPPQAPINITAGSPLALTTSGSAGTMTIQNNSTTENAVGIAANFTSTALNGLVSQTGTTCSSVTPNATCTLTFTPGSTAVAQTNFPIQGSNTSSVTGAISITSPPKVIFMTNSSYTGSSLGGFSGANAKCNSDSAKPTTGFAASYTYVALLNGNNAPVSGTKYYRTDGTTLIATANGGNLVGAASLTNAITGTLSGAWTGANGNNCSSWTSTSGNGDEGYSTSATSTWWYLGTVPCNGSHPIYCASQ